VLKQFLVGHTFTLLAARQLHKTCNATRAHMRQQSSADIKEWQKVVLNMSFAVARGLTEKLAAGPALVRTIEPR
jgi:hypothetical protein